MAQTAAHLVDHVITPVPRRQWVVSLPKRLRGFLGDRPKEFIEYHIETEQDRLTGNAAAGSCASYAQ
jgi:hypothetical protein